MYTREFAGNVTNKVLVDRQLGRAYEVVKDVYLNLDGIKAVDENKETIQAIYDSFISGVTTYSITKDLGMVGTDGNYNNQSNIAALAGAVDHVVEVSKHLQTLEDVYKIRDDLSAITGIVNLLPSISDNSDAIAYLYANMTSINSINEHIIPAVFSLGKSYKKNDICIYLGNMYICLQNSVYNTPTDTAYWQDINSVLYEDGEGNNIKNTYETKATVATLRTEFDAYKIKTDSLENGTKNRLFTIGAAGSDINSIYATVVANNTREDL